MGRSTVRPTHVSGFNKRWSTTPLRSISLRRTDAVSAHSPYFEGIAPCYLLLQQSIFGYLWRGFISTISVRRVLIEKLQIVSLARGRL